MRPSDREPSIHRGEVRKRRVLVVDDNEDLALTSSWLLKLQGHEVAVAFDGRRALEVARDFRPDVALLDVGLPHIDGYELAKRLREEYGPEVQLIMRKLRRQPKPGRGVGFTIAHGSPGGDQGGHDGFLG